MNSQHRFNRPRVFLSHSANDKKFIERLAGDLRKCQIEPWLDTEEIRDGKSWLKVIFEDGIPTCDSIMVYFTENSIKSKMVGKEIDSSLITQLSDSGIGILPYVQTAELRNTLRVDLQTLQCREWNDANYLDLLPSVVAEIWHSYMERTVGTAVAQEKNRRLELELEINKQRERYESSPFTSSEEADFKYIYDFLNQPIDICFNLYVKDNSSSVEKRKDIFQFTYLDLVLLSLQNGQVYCDWDEIRYSLLIILRERGYPEATSDDSRYINSKDNMGATFVVNIRTIGLTKRVQADDGFGYLKPQDEYSEKAFRFNYWLGFNNKLKEELEFKYTKGEEKI
jgi:hypothetical protein